MKQEKQPRCYVVAGPNGAGKTTFALKYLPLIASCHDFVNADEIAKGLSPLDYNAGLLKAGKIFLDILKQKIAQRNDFAFETTLSDVPICRELLNGARLDGASFYSTCISRTPNFPP